jgi:hypothetical protein
MLMADFDDEILRGYVAGRRLPDGRLAAVHDRGRTSILMVGLVRWTYDKHW